MNIERFVEARKAFGLSQKELADGICTQATLSRFENNGQIPNLKILIKLCNRIQLPLSELFPRVGIQNTEINKKMDQAEFNLITSEFDAAEKLLAEISLTELEDPALLMRYHYLKGFVMIFKDAPVTDILFMFDQIILSKSTADKNIFLLLAYTGVGMVYLREHDQAKAEFYFTKVFEKIYDYPIKETEDTWRVLNIVFQCAVFYSAINELETSNALLEYAISICSDNHVTYYLARAAFLLAKNAILQKKDQAYILELLDDARAYAKINKNIIQLSQLKALREKVSAGDY